MVKLKKNKMINSIQNKLFKTSKCLIIFNQINNNILYRKSVKILKIMYKFKLPPFLYQIFQHYLKTLTFIESYSIQQKYKLSQLYTFFNKDSQMFNLLHKSKRCFVNPDKINQHLFCPICLDVFQQPSRLICGHTFCYLCIQHWIKSINKHVCAQCKSDFSRRKIQKDLIASKMVDDLQVKCLHLGCSWVGRHSAHKKHQRNCQFKQRKQVKNIQNSNKVVVINDPQQQRKQVVALIEPQINSPQLEHLIVNPQVSQSSFCINLQQNQNINSHQQGLRQSSSSQSKRSLDLDLSDPFQDVD